MISFIPSTPSTPALESSTSIEENNRLPRLSVEYRDEWMNVDYRQAINITMTVSDLGHCTTNVGASFLEVFMSHRHTVTINYRDIEDAQR